MSSFRLLKPRSSVRLFGSAFGIACLLAASPKLPAAGAANTVASTILFNGRNLDGWYVVVLDKGAVEDQDIFQVDGGAIHAYKNAPDGSVQPSAGLITKEAYSDYRLTLEYRWGAKKFAPRAGPDSVRDAGVCYHVRGPDVIWPISVECQIQEGDTGDVWLVHTRGTSTVNPDSQGYATPADGGVAMTRGEDPRGYKRFPRSSFHEKEGWNLVEVTVRGDNATYRVNGHVNNRVSKLRYWDEGTSSWLPLATGKILLQAEFAEVFYRNLTIERLPPPVDN